MSYEELRKKLMEELKHHFRPEFLNRLDEIIVFRSLGKDQIKSIVVLQLNEVRKRLHAAGYGFNISERAVDQLAHEGYDPHFGARQLRRIIQRSLENKISGELLEKNAKRGADISVDYNNGQYVVSLK